MVWMNVTGLFEYWPRVRFQVEILLSTLWRSRGHESWWTCLQYGSASVLRWIWNRATWEVETEIWLSWPWFQDGSEWRRYGYRSTSLGIGRCWEIEWGWEGFVQSNDWDLTPIRLGHQRECVCCFFIMRCTSYCDVDLSYLLSASFFVLFQSLLFELQNIYHHCSISLISLCFISVLRLQLRLREAPHPNLCWSIAHPTPQTMSSLVIQIEKSRHILF